METILERISYLRRGKTLVVDRNNSNRYRIVVQEPGTSKTAYYFSTPIYNHGTGKLIDLCFGCDGSQTVLTGSNAQIRIGESVWMRNERGACEIKLHLSPGVIDGNKLSCGNAVVFPTTNGVALRAEVDGPLPVEIEVENPFFGVRGNDRYFALMDGEFRPFIVLSCIGVVNSVNRVIASTKITYERVSGQFYRVTIIPSEAGLVLFEVNLYEQKLIQDTTVESANPSVNNAFGSAAFVGNTDDFGEQWLYARLDQSKMPELMGKEINRAILHMPLLSKEAAPCMAQSVSFRFCSVGSTWDNKVSPSGWRADIAANSTFLSLDISTLIANPRTGLLTPSDGFVIKGKPGAVGATVISTADSYFAPQILEVNYR